MESGAWEALTLISGLNTAKHNIFPQIAGLAQDCSNSSANALELS